MSTTELLIARNAQAVQLQKDAIEQQGDMAIRLIQSATGDPAVGQHLNLLV